MLNIESENQIAIIHEKRKAHGFLYRVRDFYYSRSIIKKYKNYYIIDKFNNFDITNYEVGVIGKIQ